MIKLALTAQAGWRRLPSSDAEIWFTGRLYEGTRSLSLEETAAFLNALPMERSALQKALTNIDGLFAAIVKRGAIVIAVVDHIASYPLLIKRDGEVLVTDRGKECFSDGRIPLEDINHDASLALAMSGYTLGGETLARSVTWLVAGSYAIIENADVYIGRHYIYSAWKLAADNIDYSKALEAVLRQIFERLIGSLDGRTVLLPLSAGRDSRLIASALREHDYSQVKCFAYGRPGNFEARASEQIAARLGYPWTFVPYSQRSQRLSIGRGGHARYRRDSDSFAAVPFEQDFFAVSALLESGWAPRDAVIVNGQSGDFIAGNHIPESLATGKPDSRGWAAVFDAMIDKHYSLWSSARTAENTAKLHEMMSEQLRLVEAPSNPDYGAYGLFECLEYDNRQSKYVVGGQRAYECLGVEWRLPLWEKPLVEFFRKLPLKHKFRQKLYVETLERLNWGGVWSGIDDRRRVTPNWLRPVRVLTMLLAAPFGRKCWHEIERRLFAYCSDVLCNYAYLCYRQVVRDQRGFRNAVSWFTEAYLSRHGLDWRGAPKP